MSVWRGAVAINLILCMTVLTGCVTTPEALPLQDIPTECNQEKVPEKIPEKAPEDELGNEIGRDDILTGGKPAVTGGTLVGIVESKRHAKQIAKMYDITLINVVGDYALFSTGEDVTEVINRGIENGWPLLEPNHVYYTS